MEELQTITQVTKTFGVTTRMLRYYEQIGLLQSKRTEGYSYRVYDNVARLRLQQIIILRKLRVPLKQIAALLFRADSAEAVAVFVKSICELDEEIDSLSTIRTILERFVDTLRENANIRLKDDLLSDGSLFSMLAPLSLKTIEIKEDKTMKDLEQANEKLNSLTDVRIIYLPPMTVAAASGEGENSEGKAAGMINQFVLERDLLKIKPDIRHFGFDCSAGKSGIGEASHKYQMWVSIPDDMDIPKPLVKRKFTGGLYAAHMIKMGDFDHWVLLAEWVKGSDQYENDWHSVRCTPYEDDMDRCFEEQLNFWSNLQNHDFNDGNMQLDLLFPIKIRQ